MKTIFLLLACTWFLPKELKLDNSIRSYQMTTDYINFDLKGNFLDKSRFSGRVTYGLPGDSAQWNEVYHAYSRDLDNDLSQQEYLDYVQGFTYLPGDEVVLSPTFFPDNLPQADVPVMNLIWDALCFDALAYGYWDSLRLNQEFAARDMSFEFEMAGIGTFENRDIRITWLGITEMNNEKCAILKYSVMNNPLNLALEHMAMTGRSHYWGEIYVSLSDKQIEYACLTEDVLTDIKFANAPENVAGYTIRYITFSRVE